MTYGIGVNGLSIEHFMVVQFISSTICAYFAYRIVNSDIRLLGWRVPLYALAEVAGHDLRSGLDGFPYRAHDRRDARSSLARPGLR